MRYSIKELEVLKLIFAENDELILTLRNLFFGFEMSKDEKKTIKEIFSDKENRRIVRKVIIPEFDADIPVGQATDIWMSSVDGVKGNTPEVLAPIFASQIKYVGMLETALALLENVEGEKVSLKVLYPEFNSESERYTFSVRMYEQILARNNFVKVIESSLVQIRILAGTKQETVEEWIKKMEKNSAK